MKKYLSVFSLFVRSSFYKALILFLIMAGSQILLFSYKINSVSTKINSLESAVDESKIFIIFAAAFIALTVILSISGTRGKQGYTLRRLRITEKETFFCQLIFNTFTYAMLIIVELITLMIIISIFIKLCSSELYGENFITHQTVFLSFYRNDFMHSILPLDDVFRHIRNTFFIVGMGISSAAFPFLMRRKKICFETAILAIIIIFSFNDSLEAYSEISFCVLTVLLTSWAAGRCLREDVAYEK